jgi:DNA-binding beta-propeller fold protein YncE
MTAHATAARTALALVAAVTVPGCVGDESPTDRRRGGGEAPGALSTIPQRPTREGGTPAPRFTALVALEKANAAAVLRGPPWRLVRRLPLPTGPHNVAASADGRWMAVTSPPADRVTLVDVRRSRVVARPAVAGSPHDVSFARNGHALWVTAERAGRVVKLAVPGGRRIFQRRTAAPPHDLRVSPDGRRVWITLDGLPQVEVRDSTGRLRATAEPGGAPHDLAFQRGTDRIWFSNWGSGTLTVASARTGRRLGVVAAGAEPHHFAFGLGSLWVSDHGAGTLVRLDPRRRRVGGRTSVGPEPHHVAVAGSRVLVAVHESGRVAIVNRRSRRVRSIPVGPGPHGIAVAQVPVRPRP